MLSTNDADLRDLAHGAPLLIDEAGVETGIRLERWLGAGGMGAVFQARLVKDVGYPELSRRTPKRFAMKLVKPTAQREAERLNLDPRDSFLRERSALETMAMRRVFEMMAGRPSPTQYVLDYYGSGGVEVAADGRTRVLPWLAIELVDGGAAGVTLTDRVLGASDGDVDPIRALRILRGVFEGARALHEERIIHRDIKPDNVLVGGPIDDEIPKLSDCGIARVNGLLGTVAAMTPAYCGPEQILSHPGESNPLIGPWTDVHALAALVWFVLGGEHWCRSVSDAAWYRGERRSLRSAAHLHVGLASKATLLERLNAVLARGAAPRPPDVAFASRDAERYERDANVLAPALLEGEPRFATVGELGDALFPLLEECADAWRIRASREDRAVTAFRRTEPAGSPGPRESRATVEEIPLAREIASALGGAGVAPASPGGVVFQPDGKRLLKLGARLAYFVNDKPYAVAPPSDLADVIGASQWLARGPGGGYALIGPGHVLLIRGSQFTSMPMPARPGGGEVGAIQAVVEGGDLFGVVTAETEDANGGPELWVSINGATWKAPVLLPLGGDACSVAHGPYGFLVTGARKGRFARALFQPFGMQATVYTQGVNARPPLVRALCGATREAWAAGKGFVVSLERGAVAEEAIDDDGEPTAMGLDAVGVPWLVTERAVLRRHLRSGTAEWKTYYRRAASGPRLVAVGFTAEETRVIDEEGSAVKIRPLQP